MAENRSRHGKRAEGFQHFHGTLSDVPNVSANLVDEVDFQHKSVKFRGLEAGPGIILTVVDADDNAYITGEKKIVITSTGGPAGGEPNDGVNLGTGEGIYSGKLGFDLQFRSLKAGPTGAVTLTTVGDEIIVDVPGAVGPIGPQGPAGATGPQGLDGPVGPDGPAGPGVPIGGTVGQFLAKIDGTDFNAEWVDAPTTGGGGGPGTTEWLGLTDTPSTFTGQTGKIPQVNGTEDGLIFVNLPTPFSGDYNDLANQPLIPGNFSDLSGNVTELMLSVDVRNKLNDTIPNKLDGNGAPTVLDDATGGWQVGSFWIDTLGDETYRMINDTIGAAQWIKTTLTTDELATVAMTGNYSDLVGVPLVPSDFLDLGDTPGSFTGQNGKVLVVNATETGLEFSTSAGGADNTASNLGPSGEGVFAQKTGVDLQFKKIIGGSNVTLTSDGDSITINSLGPDGGEVNDGVNVGTGDGAVYKGKLGVDLQFRRLQAGTNVAITQNADEIVISSIDDGENNTASNVGGSGVGIFAQKIGSDLQFKRLVASTGISFVNNADTIEISSTGGAGGGATTFSDLTDTPTGYVANKGLAVNPAGDAIVFVDQGEANDASNLGTGTGIYAQKSGSIIDLKSIVAGAGIGITSDANEITITSTATGAGEANTASNLGTGEGVFATKTGSDLEFKSLVAGTNVTLTASGTEITIDTVDTGEANTASNAGATGVGWFKQKTGSDLEFKRIVAGSGVSLINNVDSIEVSATGTGGSPTFAGLTDTPADYTGHAGKVLKVNSLENAVEYVVGGEINNASNLGALGEGIFAQKSSTELQFKKIVAGTNVTLTADANSITIDAPDTGEVNIGTNEGSGEGNVYAGKLGAALQFRSIIAGTNLAITQTGTDITIDATDTGEANTVTNVGATGVGLFKQKTGTDLEFKRIVAGTGISLTNNADTLEIAAPTIVDQNLFETFTADTGSTTANSATDMFNIVGGAGITTAITGDTVTITNDGSVTGEVNTASSLGNVDIYAQKVGADLQFKGLIAGSNVTLTPSATGITIDALLAGGANAIDDLTDVDTTTAAPSVSDLLAWDGSNWVPNTPAAPVSSSGTNLGTGEGIYFQTVGSSIEFKTLKAGPGIALSSDLAEITITATSLGGLQNNLSATTPPTVTDDTTAGYSIGSIWIDIAGDETYRLVDGSTGAAVWAKTSLTSDELSTVALSGDYNDLSNLPTISPDQNLWDTINADTGSTSANVVSDTLTIAGGTGISTSVVGDSLIIENTSSTQNLFETIAADTGSATANLATDTLTVAGGTDITTSITGDVLTINYSGVPSVQNLWSTINADGATTTTANIPADTLTITGGTGITTAVAGDTLTITNDSPNVDQNIFETITGDTGTRTALATNETFNIVGGTNVTTTLVGSTLTIDATAGASSQNVFQNVIASPGTGSASGLPIAADSTTDSLTFIAGDNVTLTTNPTNDSLTIDVTVPGAASDFGTIALSAASGGSTVGDTNVVAETTSDTLTLDAGPGITLTGNATTDVVTISTDGAPDQNLYSTVTADTGSTTANTTTDTLNVVGAGTVTTSISGDTLTITGSAHTGGGSASTVTQIKVNYDSSGNITTVDAGTLPAGWSESVAGNSVTFTHSEGYPPAGTSYYGFDSTTSIYRHRLPNITYPLTVASGGFAGGSSSFTVDIPMSAVGGSVAPPTFSTHAYLVFKF